MQSVYHRHEGTVEVLYYYNLCRADKAEWADREHAVLRHPFLRQIPPVGVTRLDRGGVAPSPGEWPQGTVLRTIIPHIQCSLCTM